MKRGSTYWGRPRVGSGTKGSISKICLFLQNEYYMLMFRMSFLGFGLLITNCFQASELSNAYEIRCGK